MRVRINGGNCSIKEPGLSVLMLIASQQCAWADANDVNRYALLPSKVNIENCQQAALRLHAGVIDKLRVLPKSKTF